MSNKVLVLTAGDVMGMFERSIFCQATAPAPGHSIRASILPGGLEINEVKVRDLSAKEFKVKTELYAWGGYDKTGCFLLNNEILPEMYPLLTSLAAGKQISNLDLNLLEFTLNMKEWLLHSPSMMVNQVREWLRSKNLLVLL